MQNISYYIILIFILIVIVYSIIKKNNAYNSFLEGCKESRNQRITILTYILILCVALKAIKASMILDDVVKLKYVPNELLIQGIFRPISSHASLSMMLSSITTYGVDSKEGIISSVLQGGSDTTIYVMVLYFGFVGIKKTTHSYIVGLICDLICLLLCLYIFFVLL